MSFIEESSKESFEILKWCKKHSTCLFNEIQEVWKTGGYLRIDPFMINFSLYNRYLSHDKNIFHMFARRPTHRGTKNYHITSFRHIRLFIRLYDENRRISIHFIDFLSQKNPLNQQGLRYQEELEVFADRMIEKGNPLGRELSKIINEVTVLDLQSV